MNPSEILSIVRTMPAFASALADIEEKEKSAALNGRVACIDAIQSSAKRIEEMDVVITRQQREVDIAYAAYEREREKGAALMDQRAALQRQQGQLCCELSTLHGEAVLDIELQRLHTGLCSLVSDITELRHQTSGSAWLDPETAAYRHHKEKLEKIRRFTGYHKQVTAAYHQALALRSARISPEELAERVEHLLAPLRSFKYD